MNMLQTIWLVLLPILYPSFNTTIIEVERILKIHEMVKDDLSLYINEEEEKLSVIKRYLTIFKKEHEKAMMDIPGYIGNPINAFTLIKRLTSDLNYLKESVKIEKANIKREYVEYPSQANMADAAQNLVKLQEIYDLDVKELAEGKLKGVAYSTPMTAGDCYELGRLLYEESNNENIRYARAWLIEAYKKYNEVDMFYPFTQIDVIEYISMACSKMGDIENAVKWTQVLLEVDPHHTEAKEIMAYLKSILAKETKSIKAGEEITLEEELENSTLLQKTYKALCRGAMDIRPEGSYELTCHYQRENHPFLKLAPFKVEVMHHNPNVVFFYDVLSDDEIEAMKQMSIGSDIIARISRRVTDMTGLYVDVVKKPDIVKHRIGDSYMPHYDFNNMSNVAHGGATVFPALGLSVFPVKGGAVFWLNLHDSGENDVATLHVDCPVLQGSKWVATKWIYQCGQEFLRPCDGQKKKQARSMSIANSIRADFYTALTQLEDLIKTHARVIEDLQSYIDKEEERVSYLKRYLNIYKTEHKKVIENISDYLGNPINAFTLIKRLTLDLMDIKNNIELAKEYMNSAPVNHVDLNYPSLDDLKGAASALARLQRTYKLDAHDLSEGILNGVVLSSPMTASDCYEIGHALMFNYADTARAWMLEALRKYNEENITYPFTNIDIMDYLILAYYLSGDSKNALQWAQKLSDLVEDYPQSKDSLRYENTQYDPKNLLLINEGNDYDDTDDSTEEMVMKIYEHICRGEIGISPEISKRLTCRYLTEKDPYLKIAPIKMEMMHLKPDVVLYHDVLSDLEIETLKQMAKPLLRRAQIFTDSNERHITDYRTCKLSWLYDKDSDFIARLSRKVSHMTGLNIETAEPLQVVNYGIGGHYDPHFDFVREVVKMANGNRIATLMFYMSNVAQGGATVFPFFGLQVKPVKGAAIFWHNLYASGEDNMFMLHASCPVLQGSKWVANKWLHLAGQERHKPCNLKYEHDNLDESISEHIIGAVM